MLLSTDSNLSGVSILASTTDEQNKILSPEALQFISTLHREFNSTRKFLLQRRVMRQKEIDQGKLPDFLPETEHVRNDPSWRAASPGPGLEDRRIEITGPVDRKMIINALNSDAKTFMADFEGKLVLFGIFIRYLVFRFEFTYLGKLYKRTDKSL